MMLFFILTIISVILTTGTASLHGSHHIHENHDNRSDWIVNLPFSFREGRYRGNQLIDGRKFPLTSKLSEIYYQTTLQEADDTTDGESVDIVDHFFWGYRGGIALELGALDGTPSTYSMTYWMEHLLDWKRILIEANPAHQKGMKQENMNAYSVNAAICNNSTQLLHYARTQGVATSGILEFMDPNFIKKFHNNIYESCNPKGNLLSIQDWNKFSQVSTIHCLPLSKVLKEGKINYINLFILDVEGAELQILESIDWNKIKFDVLVVETKSFDPKLRPADYPAIIEAYLKDKGYKSCCGQVGRNTWFIRDGFEPSRRPGLKAGCFRGEIASHIKKQTPDNEVAKRLSECEEKKV